MERQMQLVELFFFFFFKFMGRLQMGEVAGSGGLRRL